VILEQPPNGGGLQRYPAGPAAGSLGPLLLADGLPVEITVAACEQAGACDLGSVVDTAQTTGTTMIDATPPAGAVVIAGGAVATNRRTVTLGLQAEDPLIGGRPGTSSGVAQFAIDMDGDGTFPCDVAIGPGMDTSGCAQPFSPSATAVLPPGDGLKGVGVRFGDGARAPSVPCAGPLCPGPPAGTLLGNVSAAPATDTILLDTVPPVARPAREAVVVQRGAAAAFDAAASTDASPTATPSGVDFPATSWEFADGTPAAAGSRVTHAFAAVGTFVGRLRVRDRAGNVSEAAAFTVTVLPRPGETVDGSGSVAGVSGSAAFALSRVGVSARYVRSRLSGAIRITGVSSQAGAIVTRVRRAGGGGRVLRSARRAIPAAPFSRVVPLPRTLMPGAYRVAFAGPGGTLTTTLRLTPPREGVVVAARVTRSARPAATFVFAARPAAALRPRLTIAWTQAGRRLGTVAVRDGRVVTAAVPAGVRPGPGRLAATLRAGARVVAVASARVP
jgi:hypothetical protein